jgi:ADP-heptose:LPS heptosyltransferase
LILRYDKIGDMIVTLPIFRILKTRHPNLKLGVLTSESNFEIVCNDEHVDSLFILYRNPFKLFKELYRIRKSHFQVVLNFIFNRMTSGGLISNLACKDAMKVGQGQEKYRFYFNVLLSLPRGQIHMFEMLVKYIELVFGFSVHEGEKHLRFPMDEFSLLSVNRYLEHNQLKRRSQGEIKGSNYVVFNISAGQQDNRLSADQALSIAEHLAIEMRVPTILISAPHDSDWRLRSVLQIHSERCLSFPENGSSSLREVISLLQGAVAVITPHTSIVHIAAATLTPVCGIFSPLQVNEEWLPYGVKYQFIEAGEREPVRAISLQTLNTAITKFLTPYITDGIIQPLKSQYDDQN